MFIDCIRDLLRFNAITLSEENILSPKPVDILSIDKIFLETDIAQGVIFKGKRSGLIHSIAMDVDPGYRYIENNKLVSFNGQSITFRLSIKEIEDVCTIIKINILLFIFEHVLLYVKLDKYSSIVLQTIHKIVFVQV